MAGCLCSAVLCEVFFFNFLKLTSVTFADVWEYSKSQGASGRRRRGWLYVHTSRVNSLDARYWKKMYLVLDDDLTVYHGMIRVSNQSSGTMSDDDVEGEEVSKSGMHKNVLDADTHVCEMCVLGCVCEY
jgi:hypothetical protein